jgi:hypothetical protein
MQYDINSCNRVQGSVLLYEGLELYFIYGINTVHATVCHLMYKILEQCAMYCVLTYGAVYRVLCEQSEKCAMCCTCEHWRTVPCCLTSWKNVMYGVNSGGCAI